MVIAVNILAALCFFSNASAQARTGVVEVPFEFVNNEILVQVRINGKGPLTMMLDTGTNPSSIDLVTADALGIRRSARGRQGSGGGTDRNPAYECKFATLEIGSLAAANVSAVAIDLTKISGPMGRHIDGILGHSVLNNRIVQFDYPSRMVRFFNALPAARNRAAATLGFRYDDDVLIDGVLVNGRRVTADIDTGSSGSLALSPMAVENLGLAEEAAKGKGLTSVGYNGVVQNHEGRLRSFVIGSISVSSPPVLYIARGSGHDKARWDVNIGNGFLKDYIVTIDYRGKIIRFEKP